MQIRSSILHSLQGLFVCALALLFFNVATAADPKPALSAFVIETYGSPPQLVEGDLSSKSEKAIETVFG